MDWLGKKNGEPVSLMQQAGFETLITGDQNMQYQQNWLNYPLVVIVLVAYPKRYDKHLALIPQVLDLLAQPELAGGVHIIQPPEAS